MKARSPASDHDLGIHTGRPVPLDALHIESPNRVHGNRYEPSPFPILDQMLCGLGLEYPRFTFIDLGSGKGRVLCLAARHPWKQVLGVEFSPELNEIAEQNLAALALADRRCRQLRSVCLDATELALPREPTVLYLFNPFAPSVLSRVLDRLEQVCLEDPSERWLLYYMPVHEDLIARRGFLELHSSARDWRIYRTAPR